MEQWLTVAGACHILGISERTLHRRVKAEQYQSKRENGRVYVLLDVDNQGTAGDSQLMQALQAEIGYLRKELTDTRQALTDTQRELAESRERADSIIMQLSRNAEQSQVMLQAAQESTTRPWWRRLVGRRGKEPQVVGEAAL